MDFIPAPPAGHLPESVKYEGLAFGGDSQQQQQLLCRKSKKPVEVHEFYLAVVVDDDDGHISFRAPSFLKREKAEMLKDAAENLYNEWCKRKSQQKQGLHGQDVVPSKSKRHRSPGFPPSEALQTEDLVPYPIQTSSKRRCFENQRDEQYPCSAIVDNRHGEARHLPPKNMSHESQIVRTPDLSQPMRMLQIQVGDTAEWVKWMASAFEAIQQTACRILAKQWIKAIQPKKQSTNPYNGHFPRNEHKSPERTKPPYWPPDVIHKEPDHIEKPCRINLLVHLIMNTPQKQIMPGRAEDGVAKELMAKDLLNALEKKKPEICDKWDIINEIVYVRGHLEMLAEDGCDPDCVLSVHDYSQATRKNPTPKSKAGEAEENGHEAQQDAENDAAVNGSTASTTMGASTPLESEQTPSASDDEHDTELLAASFTSNTTHDSAQPSHQAISDNRHITPAQHAEASQLAERHVVMPNSVPLPSEMDFTRHEFSYNEPSMQSSWSATASHDPQLVQSFSGDPNMHYMMDTHYHPGLFEQARATPMHHVLHGVSYHDSQRPQAYYSDAVNRELPYRTIAEMDPMIEAGDRNFNIPMSYMRTYDHGQSQSHHH